MGKVVRPESTACTMSSSALKEGIKYFSHANIGIQAAFFPF